MAKYPPANYRLEVEDRNRKPVRPMTATQKGKRIVIVGSTSIDEISPGCRLQYPIDLASEYPVADPGKYFVRATLLARGPILDNAVVSNWAELTVTRSDEAPSRDTLLPLQLTVDPPLREVRIGTGADFEVTLLSFGPRPLQVDRASGSEYRMEVTGPDGSSIPPNERGRQLHEHWLHAFPRVWIELRPGGHLRAHLDVTERYDLISPGHYTISFYRIVLDSRGVEHEVRARPVDLIVRK